MAKDIVPPAGDTSDSGQREFVQSAPASGDVPDAAVVTGMASAVSALVHDASRKDAGHVVAAPDTDDEVVVAPGESGDMFFRSARDIDAHFAAMQGERLDVKMRMFTAVLHSLTDELKGIARMPGELAMSPSPIIVQKLLPYIDTELLLHDQNLLQKVLTYLVGVWQYPDTPLAFYVLRDLQEAIWKRERSNDSSSKALAGMRQQLHMKEIEHKLPVHDRNYLGSGWRTGTLEIVGDPGDNAGDEMWGGKIIIHGRAGKNLGNGMWGGEIFAQNAGTGLGEDMRGGTIDVVQLDPGEGKWGGSCVASEMKGGSITIHSVHRVIIGHSAMGGRVIVYNPAQVVRSQACNADIALVDAGTYKDFSPKESMGRVRRSSMKPENRLITAFKVLVGRG